MGLIATAISRHLTTDTRELDHNVAGGTYSAAPTLATDGFNIRRLTGDAYDAHEFTYRYDATADATTDGSVRPWFYLPDPEPNGTNFRWHAGKIMEGLTTPAASSDVHAPVRRINSIPAAATRMYLQVVAIAGTAPAHLYMVAYGVEGDVATVNGTDIEVDVEFSGSIGAVKIEDATTTDRAKVRDGNAATAADDHVLVVQQQDPTGGIPPAGDVNTNAPWVQLTDGVEDWGFESADTAGAAATIVAPVKVLDETGKASPAGDTAGNAPFAKLTDGTDDLGFERADTAGAVGTITVPTKQLDLTGAVQPAGADAATAITMMQLGQLMGASGPGIYSSGIHFTAVYQAATAIDISGGFPAITDIGQFVGVAQISNAGAVTIFYPHRNVFSWDAANSRLTVTGATFAATDVFVMVIRGADRYANDPGNHLLSAEVLPLNLRADDRGIDLLPGGAQAFTDAWVDVGPEIPMFGKGGVAFFLTLDINDDSDLRFRVLGKHESGGTEEYLLPIKTVTVGVVNVQQHYVEFTEDIDQLIIVDIETAGRIPYFQPQILRGTDGGGVDANLNALYYVRSLGGAL